MEKLKLSTCLKTIGDITTDGGLPVKDLFKKEYAALKQAIQRIKEIDSMKSDEWVKASDAVNDIFFNADFNEDTKDSSKQRVQGYTKSPETHESLRHQCNVIKEYILHSSGFDIKCAEYEEVLAILTHRDVDIRAFKIGYYKSYGDYKSKMNLARADYGVINWRHEYELKCLGLLTQKQFKVVNEWFAQEPASIVWRRVWQ